MSNAVKQTVHKGSRGIDFISHNLKASITRANEPDSSTIPLPEVSDFRIKSTTSPIRSFYRPNPIDKLIKTIRYRNVAETAVFPSMTLTTGEERSILPDTRFDAPREAIEFFKQYDGQSRVLNVPPKYKFDSSVPESISKSLGEIIDGSEDSLERALDFDMGSIEGSKVTNEDKIKYIIATSISKDVKSVHNVLAFTLEYINELDDAKMASSIMTYLLHTITQPALHESQLDISEELALSRDSMFNTYSSLSRDSQLIDAFAKAALYIGDTVQTKQLIDLLKYIGFAPSFETLDTYLKLKAQKKKRSQFLRTDYLKTVIDLEDAIHTHFCSSIASSLIKSASTTEEILFIIRSLEKKVEAMGKERKAKTMENFISSMKQKESLLFGADASRQPDRLVQNINNVVLYNEFRNYQKPTKNLNKYMLVESVKQGSFIFACKLLKTMSKIDEVLQQDIFHLASTRELHSSQNDPGFDNKSKEFFLQAFRQHIEDHK